MKYTNLFISILFILLLSSCKDEEVIPIQEPKKIVWEEHPKINGLKKYLINHYVTDNKAQVRFYGNGYLNTLDTSGAITTSIYNYGPETMNLPMKTDLFVGFYENALGAGNTYLTVYNLSLRENLLINFEELDSSFLFFDGPSNITQDNGSFAALNNQDQLLTAARTEGFDLNFYLIDIETIIDSVSPSSSYIDLGGFKKISLSNSSNTFFGGSPRIWSFDDNFIVSLPNNRHSFVVISPDGNYQDIVWPVSGFYPFEIFKKENTLYAVSWDILCTSTDGGYTWEPLVEFAFQADSFLFNVVGDHIILSKNSRLYHLVITSNDVIIKEIKNEGMAGNEVTSMVLFDGQVYITTLSGLFLKDFKAFFDYVE